MKRKRELPKTLKVAGFTYTINTEEGNERYLDALEAWAATSLQKRTLYFQHDQDVEQLRESVLHEVVHVVRQIMGVRLQDTDGEEKVVKAISMGLNMVLVDNPELVEWLRTAYA